MEDERIEEVRLEVVGMNLRHRDGLHAKLLLFPEEERGHVVTALDADGNPVPDAPIARRLSAEDVRLLLDAWRAMMVRMVREGTRSQAGNELVLAGDSPTVWDDFEAVLRRVLGDAAGDG